MEKLTGAARSNCYNCTGPIPNEWCIAVLSKLISGATLTQLNKSHAHRVDIPSSHVVFFAPRPGFCIPARNGAQSPLGGTSATSNQVQVESELDRSVDTLPRLAGQQVC